MNENPYEPPTVQTAPEVVRLRACMNAFDKLCAALAFVLGIVFVFYGALGLFMGCTAWFSLPQGWGVLPAFIGWGMLRPIYLAWNVKRQRETGERGSGNSAQ